jgi:hypothetical protein
MRGVLDYISTIYITAPGNLSMRGVLENMTPNYITAPSCQHRAQSPNPCEVCAGLYNILYRAQKSIHARYVAPRTKFYL